MSTSEGFEAKIYWFTTTLKHPYLEVEKRCYGFHCWVAKGNEGLYGDLSDSIPFDKVCPLYYM